MLNGVQAPHLAAKMPAVSAPFSLGLHYGNGTLTVGLAIHLPTCSVYIYMDITLLSYRRLGLSLSLFTWGRRDPGFKCLWALFNKGEMGQMDGWGFGTIIN